CRSPCPGSPSRTRWARQRRVPGALPRPLRARSAPPQARPLAVADRKPMATADLLQLLPRYHQIKEALRAELARLPPGGRLPGVRALRHRFHTSQTTLDRALRELENDGLISREHGRGMFVTGPRRPPRTLRLAALCS